jgi:hypothetical protein
VGRTRSSEKLESLRELGAEPVLGDVYDYEALLRVAQRRVVVESAAFALDADSAAAVERLEQAKREFAGESVILRFGRFWGPGTGDRTPPIRRLNQRSLVSF